MSWRRKTVWFTNRLLIGFTLLAYICTLISPGIFWPAAFVAYLIPALQGLNIFYMYLWYYKNKRYMLYSLGCLAIGYPFIFATLALNIPKKPDKVNLSVLSYNTHVFNVYSTYKGDSNKKMALAQSKEMIEWVLEHDADIKCFQEFYTLSGSEIFDFRSLVKKQGKYNLYVPVNRHNIKNQEFGLAILSRYPIIKSGLIDFEGRTDNSASFIDVLHPIDTLRIINVHLESLRLKEKEIESTQSIKANSKNIFSRLKLAFIKRASQLESLNTYINASPHPVILCGDINDLPYSYTYMKLSGWLDNSFEDASNGLGFTYNGASLFFLRIDHQFYSKSIEAIYCETMRNISYSDHFPIKATYKLSPD